MIIIIFNVHCEINRKQTFFYWFNATIIITKLCVLFDSTFSMVGDLVSDFFARSTYCSPEVLERIQRDIATVTTLYPISVQSTTWGSTNQPRLCVYGQLPLCASAHDRLPLQIWLTHQYPVDPPTIYAVSPCWGAAARADRDPQEGIPQVRSRHPNVDHTGFCYCAALAAWNPRTSTIVDLLKSFAAELAVHGCPFSLLRGKCQRDAHESLSDAVSIAAHDSYSDSADQTSCVICFSLKPNVVFVPCGHFCCCQGCASNVFRCPICRITIQLRQSIVEFQ